MAWILMHNRVNKAQLHTRFHQVGMFPLFWCGLASTDMPSSLRCPCGPTPQPSHGPTSTFSVQHVSPLTQAPCSVPLLSLLKSEMCLFLLKPTTHCYAFQRPAVIILFVLSPIRACYSAQRTTYPLMLGSVQANNNARDCLCRLFQPVFFACPAAVLFVDKEVNYANFYASIVVINNEYKKREK